MKPFNPPDERYTVSLYVETIKKANYKATTYLLHIRLHFDTNVIKIEQTFIVFKKEHYLPDI